MKIGSATLSPALTPGFYLFSMDFLQRFNHEKSSSNLPPVTPLTPHHWATGPLGPCSWWLSLHPKGQPYLWTSIPWPGGHFENQLLQLRQPPITQRFPSCSRHGPWYSPEGRWWGQCLAIHLGMPVFLAHYAHLQYKMNERPVSAGKT